MTFFFSRRLRKAGDRLEEMDAVGLFRWDLLRGRKMRFYTFLFLSVFIPHRVLDSRTTLHHSMGLGEGAFRIDSWKAVAQSYINIIANAVNCLDPYDIINGSDRGEQTQSHPRVKRLFLCPSCHPCHQPIHCPLTTGREGISIDSG